MQNRVSPRRPQQSSISHLGRRGRSGRAREEGFEDLIVLRDSLGTGLGR